MYVCMESLKRALILMATPFSRVGKTWLQAWYYYQINISHLLLHIGSAPHESSPGQCSDEPPVKENIPHAATFTAVEDQTCHSANTASTTYTESANGGQQASCFMLLPAPLINTPDGQTRQVDMSAVRELLRQEDEVLAWFASSSLTLSKNRNLLFLWLMMKTSFIVMTVSFCSKVNHHWFLS